MSQTHGTLVFCSEGENEVWYYSSRVQLDELVRTLDPDHWERDLVRAILEVKEDIVRQMALTEELTRELKGHKKAVLDMEAGSFTLSSLRNLLLSI